MKWYQIPVNFVEWNEAERRSNDLSKNMSRSHRTKKSPILTQIEHFQTVSPGWIHQWLRNDAQNLKLVRRVALLFSRSSVKFQGHTGWKTNDLSLIWAFPVGNSNSNYRMATKWHTLLLGVREIPYCFSRSSVKFQCLTGQKFWFGSNLGKITWPVATIKSSKLALLCKLWPPPVVFYSHVIKS